ncbi:MAG: hypothetical protein HY223_03150 [Thaumarchaeota archaeon]|nr:hypothetical protein [Nitrososphaerota archaeon]
MVKETIKSNNRFYLCEACGFGYNDMQTAQKCESFCKEHNSCSMEITKNAVLK